MSRVVYFSFSLVVFVFLAGFAFVNTSFGCENDNECPPLQFCGDDKTCRPFAQGIPSTAPTRPSAEPAAPVIPFNPPETIEGSSCQIVGQVGAPAKTCPPQTFCDNDKICKTIPCRAENECGIFGTCGADGFCKPKGCSSDNDCPLSVCINGVCQGRGQLPTAVVGSNPPPPPGSLSAGIPCLFNGNDGILTAIGCIPYNPVAFVNGLVNFAILVGGGVALLIMAYAALQMITQGSDPKALQAAQQKFVAAITGLLFIIFSVLILRIIGVDLLQIPGFGR